MQINKLLIKSPPFNSVTNRYIALAAMEDMTKFALGGNTITGSWIGSVNSFQIGRKVNESFVNFITYANREDIQAIVSKDSEEFAKAIMNERELNKDSFSELSKKIKLIKKSSLMPMATLTKAESDNEIEKLTEHPFYCRIYQVVMDENSEAAIEFQNYVNSVHRRATYNLTEKAQQYLKDLESMH